jgi:hypothetical protein
VGSLLLGEVAVALLASDGGSGGVNGLDKGVNVEGAQWNDRLSRVEHKTLIKLSETPGVPIGELFADNESSRGNGGGSSKNGNVVESEDNKEPVLVGLFTPQQARVLEITPAFATSLPTEQARVPYRKAA